jgi:two-component system chemotaxis response regulator CheB
VTVPGPSAPSVLVVDDSALARTTLVSVLSAAGVRVEVAPDAIVAMKKVTRSRPDAIVLDIEMPRMDGLTFLRWLRAQENPVPAVVCSAHAGAGSAAAMYALECGAVAVVERPRLGQEGIPEETIHELVDAVRGAATARVVRHARIARRDRGEVRSPRKGPAPAHRPAAGIVVVGASAGGPEALHAVLERLPHGAPPIAVVQHMPKGFTAAFARSLRASCAIEVKEAEHLDRLSRGLALVAPGGRQMTVRRDADGWHVEVLDGPRVNRHRPSVDVLFYSTAQAAGARATGVLLTGMGSDGAHGLLEMRRAGARTVAQDEATCAIFGMPKEAIALNAATDVLPLQDIPGVIAGTA